MISVDPAPQTNDYDPKQFLSDLKGKKKKKRRRRRRKPNGHINAFVSFLLKLKTGPVSPISLSSQRITLIVTVFAVGGKLL